MKKYVILSLLFATIFTVHAQKNKDVLMTINGKPIYNQEFISVYEKNLDLVKDETQKSVDGYLNLFIDYKLKVAEAYAQGLQKDANYIREFEKYRDQLSRNYIYDTKLTEDLAIEAFERSKEEVNADHILVKVGYDATPQDTLTAYNKIKEARKKALAGESFVTLVGAYSEEPGAASRGGALGYFTAFSMVYPFENMAYATPKGEISEIVRTSFGYHILKVNDRRASSAPILASHIMIAVKDGNDAEAEKRINEIYQLLQQGSDFESLAKEFSDDKASGAKGGRLKKFKRGQLRASEFEDAAYELKDIGDISRPVKTNFGWHVIRLEERFASQTYEEQKEELMKKIERGDRSKVVKSSVNKKIKEKYGLTATDYMDDFLRYVSDDLLKRKWEMDTLVGTDNKVLFNIGGDKNYHYNDLLSFISTSQSGIKRAGDKKQMIKNLYDQYETKQLSEYFKQKLEENNPEYGAVITEYRDGLLIFDVMQKNVWQKAANDSVGSLEYYNRVASKYQWEERVRGIEISGNDNTFLERARQMLEDGQTAEEVKDILNKDGKVNVLITERVYENNDTTLPDDFEFKIGLSTIFKVGDTFRLLKVDEVLPAGQKSYEDVRGKVLSEYQTVVEREWMESLRAKYEVDVNKRQLKKIKKKVKR